ncbi:MAG TPA: M28 family peptidase [Verrucomicrobiae bacterium]|nr:M28 family peptidase [Verrucomicrobiae bacterium]
MNLVHSRTAKSGVASPEVRALLDTITEEQLRKWVERISIPRHFAAEPHANRATAAWLNEAFETQGFRTELQGQYSNILALPPKEFEEVILVGAHYDSVPMCPGADDNGSAVAAMLGCAAACSLWRPVLPVMFVAFNCEEDGLAGSRDFVASYLPKAAFKLRSVHILEMVGFASSVPGSQRVPAGLPVKIRDRGDFLGLLANRFSNELMDSVLQQAATYTPQLPVTGLKVRLGLEKHFPVLARSDHAPFWAKEIPALMWTDTSEFRNSNYHLRSDTPDTLDYGFLRSVTQLLTATVIEQAQDLL